MGRKKKVTIDMENLKKVADLHRQLKQIEAELEVCKAQLKSEMDASGTDKVEEFGVTATLARKSRTTVKKHALDFLMGKNLFSCIESVPQVNVECVKAEVGKTLSKAQFSEIITETEYCALIVK